MATIGFCNTGVAMKSLEVFQAAKSPLIVPCATGTPITSKYPAPESCIFRTSARDAIQAPFVVGDIVARGWTRVAIFADTSGYGESGLQDVIKALEAKKLKPVHVARFALGMKDLTAELKAAQAAGANVIFSYTVGQENAVIALGRQALGWKVTQVAPGLCPSRSFLTVPARPPMARSWRPHKPARTTRTPSAATGSSWVGSKMGR